MIQGLHSGITCILRGLFKVTEGLSGVFRQGLLRGYSEVIQANYSEVIQVIQANYSGVIQDVVSEEFLGLCPIQTKPRDWLLPAEYQHSRKVSHTCHTLKVFQCVLV